MTDFLSRQFEIIFQSIVEYRAKSIGLQSLIGILEGLANVIEDEFWKKEIFETAWSLEKINSELIDKKRFLFPAEQEKILRLLKNFEMLIRTKNKPS